MSGSTAPVALVTGGGRRVGAAIVRALHQRGLRLVVHCHRSRRDADALAAELTALRPASVCVVQADLLDVAGLDRLAADTRACFGRVDVLVNNASSFHATPLADVDEAAWHDLVGTNLKAPLFLSRALAPDLVASAGAIVNIVDIHAERPMAGHVVYSLAKGGLATLTRALARELAPAVRVNGVAPGPVLWPETGEWADALRRREIIDHTLLQRAGTPEDIAGAVRFLALDASYVTGAILPVDGGRSARL